MGRSGSVLGMVMVIAGGIDLEMVLRRVQASSVCLGKEMTWSDQMYQSTVWAVFERGSP